MAGMVELEYLGNTFSILTRSETLHVQFNACKSKSFENGKFLKIISGIQRYNKKYHQKLNHF